MAATHVYDTTFERTNDDGIVVDSAEVRIHYMIDPNAHPAIVDGAGYPALEIGVDFERAEVRDGQGGYEPACDTIAAWAQNLIEADPAPFIEHAENETAISSPAFD